MIQGQPQPRLLPVVNPDDVAQAVVNAVREDKFEVWVPASQAISAGLRQPPPRPLRESVLRAMGVGRNAGEADPAL